MPNFVKLDSKPFDPETYVGPEAEGTYEKEKSLSIKLEVENTIRWRWRKDETGQYVSTPCSTTYQCSYLVFRRSSPTAVLYDGLTDP